MQNFTIIFITFFELSFDQKNHKVGKSTLMNNPNGQDL